MAVAPRPRLRRARIGRFDQNRAHAHAAVGDHSALTAYEKIRIVAGHHFGRDPFEFVIAALPFDFGAMRKVGKILMRGRE